MVLDFNKFEKSLKVKTSPKEFEIFLILKNAGILKDRNYSEGDLGQTVGCLKKITNSCSVQNPKEIVYHRIPDRNKPKFIAHQAHPFVKQIRKYYFHNYYSKNENFEENFEKPPFTKEEANAWIKKNVVSYKKFFELPTVLIKTNIDLTEDVRELAIAAGWREADTLWHVLIGQTPKIFEYRIAGYEYKYRGPITEEEFSRNWVSIQIDIENLTFEIMKKAYKKAKEVFHLRGKRVISVEDQGFVDFVDKRLKDTGDQKMTKKFWEEILKDWKEDHRRNWKDWNAPRMTYKRIKERLKNQPSPKNKKYKIGIILPLAGKLSQNQKEVKHK